MNDGELNAFKIIGEALLAEFPPDQRQHFPSKSDYVVDLLEGVFGIPIRGNHVRRVEIIADVDDVLRVEVEHCLPLDPKVNWKKDET